MNKKYLLKFLIFFFLCLIINAQIIEAASKKPVISITKSTQESTTKKITLTITIQSDSGIKTVKWLEGKKKIADFKSAGKKLSVSKKKASFKVSKNGTYTVYVLDKSGNAKVKVIEITNIDHDSPEVDLTYSVMNQQATVNVDAIDYGSGVSKILWLDGYTDDLESDEWIDLAEDITDSSNFTTESSGTYSVLIEDYVGNKSIAQIDVTLEFNAIWISYLEFGNTAKTKEEFEEKVNTMFDHSVYFGMNAVIVQVRPFSDALYKSKYFPWSRHISGQQGTDPGYDPLEYMVNAAHERGLEIHAWLNPYRVTASLTETGLTNAQIMNKLTDSLADNNPAKKWLLSDNETDNRNVLMYNKALYYNPSSATVQKLIINGVKEIVGNYDVDGIHFDDYFYPSLGTNASKVFDNIEYNEYATKCKENETEAMSIANWRRNNVSTFVKKTYNAIKKINPSVKFGISPVGNINNLRSNSSYFVDIDKWLSTPGYVDYICPQIYWGFEHSSAAFDKMVDLWIELRTSDSINLYIGIPVYKAGSNVDAQNGVSEWATNDDILSRQIEYSRQTGVIDGFMHYRYDSFNSKTTQTEVANMLETLSNQY